MILLLSGLALAESWCAYPLEAHEWGVRLRGSAADPAPPWAQQRPPLQRAPADPVRDLPADNGLRELPVLYLYAPDGRSGDVPIAVEVGFGGGEATAWYPQVDVLRSPAEVLRRGAEHQRWVATLAAGGRPDTGDPTAQLAWESLRGGASPAVDLPRLAAGDVRTTLRSPAQALWLHQGDSAERFLFYEGVTPEPDALTLERGPTWAPGYLHWILRNTSPWPVYDVMVVEGDAVFFAPLIPPGAIAGFVHGATVDRDPVSLLRGRLVDQEQPAPSPAWRMDRDECVMMRDPAVPTRQSEGHRLYQDEVDALLALWGDRLLGGPGARIIYRESPALLDAVMPLAIYSDMAHDPHLRRTGLVLWTGLDLRGGP
ncbi:MAG: hypothetical protein JXX28_02305 [Deltaproteobacteria bacterium]|nr:hypothetical protein [Deltaproteobacteria bacterium]